MWGPGEILCSSYLIGVPANYTENDVTVLDVSAGETAEIPCYFHANQSPDQLEHQITWERLTGDHGESINVELDDLSQGFHVAASATGLPILSIPTNPQHATQLTIQYRCLVHLRRCNDSSNDACSVRRVQGKISRLNFIGNSFCGVVLMLEPMLEPIGKLAQRVF